MAPPVRWPPRATTQSDAHVSTPAAMRIHRGWRWMNAASARSMAEAHGLQDSPRVEAAQPSANEDEDQNIFDCAPLSRRALTTEQRRERALDLPSRGRGGRSASADAAHEVATLALG